MNKGKSEFKFNINADPIMVEAVIRNYLVTNKYGPIAKPGANYYLSTDILNGNRSMEYYINGSEVTILAYMGTFEKPQNLEGFVGALPKHAFRNDLNSLFEELKKLEYAGNMQPYAAQPNPTAQPYAAQPNPAAQQPYTAQSYTSQPDPMAQSYATQSNPTAQPYATQPDPMAQSYATQSNPNTQPYAAQPNPMAQPYAAQSNQTAQPYTAQPYATQPNQTTPLYTAQPYGNGQPVNNSLNSFVEQANKKKETGAIVGFVLSLFGLLLSCFGIYYGLILVIIEFYLAINGLHTKKKGLAIAGIVLASLSILIILAELVLEVILSI